MTAATQPDKILIVTGMSGAGKSTALKTLEDASWEVVDNLPFSLLGRLLETRLPEGAEQARPLALGVDSRTRGFSAQTIVDRIKTMRDKHGRNIATLFLDCAGGELERRYGETRRRHPLAPDRPAADGIARERELIAPLRRWADHVIDTTAFSANDLRLDLRQRFESQGHGDPTLAIMSFGYKRGLPRNADLVFDMRYLRNPHWIDGLREGTGLDADVRTYIDQDPAWAKSIDQIASLLMTLLPRYAADGKAYVTVAFGCTGGRHRSVYVAEFMGERLRAAGFVPSVTHRDLGSVTGTRAQSDADGLKPTAKVQAGQE